MQELSVLCLGATRFCPCDSSATLQVTWAVVAWFLNFTVIWVTVRMMSLSFPPNGLEILAYSGYIFVNFGLSILCGWVLGRGIGWHAAWLYTSLCMCVFLIRTFKYYIRLNGTQPGMPTRAPLQCIHLQLCIWHALMFTTHAFC
jgi:hypothetical protein